jgi:hypothetical protein
MSYIFQYTLVDTMRQYAALAAEEHLSPGGTNCEKIQRDFLQRETDAELADDAICVWDLEGMDLKALEEAFAELRRRLTT